MKGAVRNIGPGELVIEDMDGHAGESVRTVIDF